MKINGLTLLGDFCAFWLTLLIIIYLRFNHQIFLDALIKHLYPFAFLYLSWILVFYLFGLYDLFKIKPTIPNLKLYFLASIVSFICGVGLFYFLPIFDITPKTNLIYQIIGYILFAFMFRRYIYNLYSSQIIKPVILIGRTKYLEDLSHILNENPQIGLKVLDIVETFEESLKYVNTKNLVMIIENNNTTINETNTLLLFKKNVEVIDIVNVYEKYLFKIPSEYISRIWIIENINTKKNIIYSLVTRTTDVLFSLIILIVSSPFLLIASIFIYLEDKGKILYIQERVGLNSNNFKLYKLRSMVENAESNVAVWATENDPRITRIGKILRKIHLDEIPQMFNILRGDITLVGPRPERPDFVKVLDEKIPNYRLRHIIKPGFTGWAQIKYHYARTNEDSKEKFEYDLYYIKNRNIFMNFGIILRTIQIIFTH